MTPGTRLLAIVLACAALSPGAAADHPWELWPEAQVYLGLNARTRLFLDAAYARGKESDEASLDLAAYLDVSFLPIGPRRRQRFGTEDTRYDGWARALYQAGGEFTVNRNWRFELYLAHQADNLPNVSRLNAFGVVLKAYY